MFPQMDELWKKAKKIPKKRSITGSNGCPVSSL